MNKLDTTNEYTLDNLMNGSLDFTMEFPTSSDEKLNILGRVIILMAKGKENTFGTVPNGWDMNEIIAQIVLDYGQEFEQLARLMILHMMQDKSYGEGGGKLHKELVKIYNGKEDKYLQYVEG